MKKPGARHTTVPRGRPPRRPSVPKPRPTPRPPHSKPAASVARSMHSRPRRTHVAHIIDDDDKSLVDVIDSLLNQGVMLNADVILALANVDLVYLRLSALLCAADRIIPPVR
jgi:hypothetical protein